MGSFFFVMVISKVEIFGIYANKIETRILINKNWVTDGRKAFALSCKFRFVFPKLLELFFSQIHDRY